jgi:hypothetical protein
MKRFAKTPEELRKLWNKVLDLGYRNPVPTAAVEAAYEQSQRKSGFAAKALPLPKGSGKGKGLVSPALTEALTPSSRLSVRSRLTPIVSEMASLKKPLVPKKISLSLEKLPAKRKAATTGQLRKRRRSKRVKAGIVHGPEESEREETDGELGESVAEPFIQGPYQDVSSMTRVTPPLQSPIKAVPARK